MSAGKQVRVRGSPAPQVNWPFALQYRVVGEGMGQTDLRGGEHRDEADEGKQESVHWVAP